LRWTTAAQGDLSIDAGQPGLDRRRRAVLDLPWTWLRQVHGAGVVRVRTAGEHTGVEADAAVTSVPGVAIAVQTADCVPIALVADGAVAVVHAGWRGLAAGVLEAAASELAVAGTGPVRAEIGPCIRARCYEFGKDDLDLVASRLGDGVRATTGWGTPALDVVAAATAALGRVGVTDVVDHGTCTACSPVHYSHRARGDRGRQALVAWLQS
jgi:YfiH family protein